MPGQGAEPTTLHPAPLKNKTPHLGRFYQQPPLHGVGGFEDLVGGGFDNLNRKELMQLRS